MLVSYMDLTEYMFQTGKIILVIIPGCFGLAVFERLLLRTSLYGVS